MNRGPRTGRAKPGRGRAMLWRWLGALALVAMVGAAVSWWSMRHWVPPRETYGVQGWRSGRAMATSTGRR
jgi:hypothetical protein